MIRDLEIIELLIQFLRQANDDERLMLYGMLKGMNKKSPILRAW